MVASLKYFVHLISLPALYALEFGISIFSIFREPKWGLLFMVFFVSQPNIWYKFQNMPLGNSFLDVLFVSVSLGMFVRKREFVRGRNSLFVVLLVCLSYLSVWNSSLRFGLGMPISKSNSVLLDWKNYAEMMLLYFLVVNVVREEKDQKAFVTCLSIVVLIISVRCFRGFGVTGNFDWGNRMVGPFYVENLGPNHLGAFIAEYTAAIWGLLLFEKGKLRRALFLATCLFAFYPLLYSYSRAGYLAFFVALTFLGVFGRRVLLVFVIFGVLAWQSALPSSVVDRIDMTEEGNGDLEQSAAMRITLWEEAMQQFREHPVFGLGFNGFNLREEGAVRGMRDTHNYYVKVLAEEGIVGFCLLIATLVRAFWSGLLLRQKGKTAFQRGLGLAFMACVIATTITNMFGDRFSQFSIGSFFWILWGLVDRGIVLSKESLEREY
jgi:putative inorganic carbon (HCO3(-)) transporter